MEPKLYRAALHLRRCVIYLIVGFFILLPLMVALAVFVSPDRRVGLIGVFGLLSALFLSFAPFWLWAIRIDDGGLDRRRLIRWDRWTWGDFASGRIEKRHPMDFVDPQRPWWRRKLSIGLLSAADAKEVMARINEHYRLPPPPVYPSVLRLEFALRKSIEFDDGCIRVKKGAESSEFTWSDVSRVRINRMDSLRRDFASLELSLGGQEIELRRGPDGRAFWSGASGEEVNEFLLARVPANRIVVDIFGECPTQLVDIVKMLERAKKSQRLVKPIVWFLALMIIGFIVGGAIENGLRGALPIALSYGVFLAPIIWFARKMGHDRIAKFESWLASRQRGQS